MSDYEPTPEQTAILAHPPTAHGRVLAGPGTGKSATVVAYIVSLLGGETAPRIRLLTFTRAATGELAQKVLEHPQAEVERPSTIHSFAISVLLRNPGSADFPNPLRIADDWEMQELVRPQLARLCGTTPTVVKKQLLPEMAAMWESLEAHPSETISDELRTRFLGAWDQHRRVMGYTLLAELPDLLRRALENHPDLDGLGYDILVVDEYQDLNACDLRVLQLISEKGTAVLAVGDDEQSLYSFRKAAPEGILRFLDDYPGAVDYTLSVSHRCAARIVQWARHVIEASPHRDPDRPRLQAAEGAPEGETALLAFKSDAAEAKGVAELITRLVDDEGIEASEILVLFRGDHNQGFSAPIRAALPAHIPAFDPGEVNAVLNSDEVRLALLVLRLLVNRRDSLAWSGLLSLTSGVGDRFQRHIYEQAATGRALFADALLAGLDDEYAGAPAVSRTKAATAVRGVLQWLDENALPDEPPAYGWADWIARRSPPFRCPTALAELLAGVEEQIDPNVDLGRYLGQIAPLARDRALAHGAGVRFMSMASSKGLTVEATIVVAVEEGIVPHPDGDLEEERRLLYVALTRGRRHAYATWARRRRGPTARSGLPRVMARRDITAFLRHGPVRSQDGEAFLTGRWGDDGAERAHR